MEHKEPLPQPTKEAEQRAKELYKDIDPDEEGAHTINYTLSLQRAAYIKGHQEASAMNAPTDAKNAQVDKPPEFGGFGLDSGRTAPLDDAQLFAKLHEMVDRQKNHPVLQREMLDVHESVVCMWDRLSVCEEFLNEYRDENKHLIPREQFVRISTKGTEASTEQSELIQRLQNTIANLQDMLNEKGASTGQRREVKVLRDALESVREILTEIDNRGYRNHFAKQYETIDKALSSTLSPTVDEEIKLTDTEGSIGKGC